METETQERTSGSLTKRDLVDQNFGALNQTRVDTVKITPSAGGIVFASALEVMEFAKLMAMSDKAVPLDFRGNAGMCLAITMQAVEWRMSPFQVANKAYVVNDRLAYESQLIHAVIEARAPLKERLACTYSGDGLTRKIKILGKFIDGTTRDYDSPELSKIKKKSPLWTDDPDQQLFYYGSRSWARKWCPDVLLGIYSKEEIEADPQLGRDEPPLPGLHARLVGGSVSRDEGHKDGHVDKTIDQINGKTTPAPTDQPKAEPEKAADGVDPDSPLDVAGFSDKTAAILKQHGIESLAGVLMLTETKLKGMKGVSKAAVGHIKATVEKNGFKLRIDEPAQQEAAGAAAVLGATLAPPKNAREWEAYCRKWLDESADAAAIRERWNDERQLRNGCGVTSEERQPVQDLMMARCKELGEGNAANQS